MFVFFKDFFSSKSSRPVNSFKNYLRYTLFLLLLFAMTFGIGLVYMLRSSEEYQLINFKGQDILTTLKWLEERNLKLKLFERIEANTPKYKVISQEPLPGEIVKEGRTISLVVSSGSHFVVIPNYVSNTFEDAKKNIYSLFAGYQELPNVVRVNRYSVYSEGLVVEQFPKEGETLTFDQEIILVVSQGLVEEAFRVENYRRKKYRDVEKILVQKGIKVKTQYYLTKKKNLNGYIFNQSIKPNNFLLPGESISFDVGIFSDKEIDDQNELGEMIRFYSFRIPFRATHFEENNADLESIRQQYSNQYLEGILGSQLNKRKETRLENNGSLGTNRGTVRSTIQQEKPRDIVADPAPLLRKIRLMVTDSLGEHIALEEDIPSGKIVDLPYKTIGSGTLSIYIDENLYEIIEY